MEQPKGFKDSTDRVCKLNKAVYGLKYSRRVWNKNLIRSKKVVVWCIEKLEFAMSESKPTKTPFRG